MVGYGEVWLGHIERIGFFCAELLSGTCKSIKKGALTVSYHIDHIGPYFKVHLEIVARKLRFLKPVGQRRLRLAATTTADPWEKHWHCLDDGHFLIQTWPPWPLERHSLKD